MNLQSIWNNHWIGYLLGLGVNEKPKYLVNMVSVAVTEFLDNLLKMSVLPCCPHNPASSVSAMFNEINFLGGALK